MRFIIHEQLTETLLAAGAYRYAQDGRPTGAVESWRLTRVAPGYQALRVDLDARDAPSGHSYLYHYVRQSNGRPARLTYRFWNQAAAAASLKVEGKLIFSETDVVGTHVVNGRSHEIQFDLPPGYVAWFPSVAGLGLAAAAPGQQTGLTLQNEVGGADALRPQVVSFHTQHLADSAEVAIGRRTVPAISVRITWNAHQRLVACDAHGWPVTMQPVTPIRTAGLSRFA